MADLGINDSWAISDLEGFHEDGPSIEELAIDESLSDLEKLQRYLSAEFVLHRLFTLKDICDTSRRVGYQTTVTHILPLFDRLVADSEPVIRQTLLQQLPPLATVLIAAGGEAGYERVLSALVPLAAGLLTDGQSAVRDDAVSMLVDLAKVVRPEHQATVIVPHVLRLGKDGIDEDARAAACRLINELSCILPLGIVTNSLLPLLAEIATDPMFRTRKAVASKMNVLAGVLAAGGKLQPLLDLYSTLCADEMWGVRKACAEAVPVLAEHVDDGVRTALLLPRFLAFAEDASRWVRSAAYEALGRFIATFRAGSVPPALVALFAGMSAPTLVKTVDSDITTYCAFNFPAVMQTLGPAAWPGLRPTYETLAKDVQLKVRRSLSFSIAVVAGLIGTEQAEEALVPVFEGFLTRDLDEIRVGAFAAFASFMAVLSPASRLRFLPILVGQCDASDNWRFRETVAEQIGPLAGLLTPDAVCDQLVPLLFALCEDSVAAVRETANATVGPVLRGVLDHAGPERAAVVIAHVRGMAAGASYQSRQMFVRCCSGLLDHIDDAVFDESFGALLLRMKDDKVAVVRLMLAKVLQSLRQRPAFLVKPALAAALSQLQADQDADVAFYASQGHP